MSHMGKVWRPIMGKVVDLAIRRRAASTLENGKVSGPPRRQPNRALRTREYLTAAEIERLLKAADQGRYGHRDRTLVLIMYRHGLRVGELVTLRWEQLDIKAGLFHVARLKNGVAS